MGKLQNPAPKSGNKTLIFFLVAVVLDIAAMNIPDFLPEKIGDRVYFTFESANVALLILCISILSKDNFVLNTASSAWFVLALNDLWEQIIGEGYVSHPYEYWFFGGSFIVVCYKIYGFFNPVYKRFFNRFVNNIKKRIFVKTKT